MDTRFWGPSGWKLFHLITFHPVPPADLCAFVETLPYILPCKFCRASLTDYLREHPCPTDPSKTAKWMYTIHNCVNDKLRAQGLQPSPNPPYRQVHRLYETLSKQPWQSQLLLFWDFLFSVGYHHPKEKTLYSEPMPDCPPEVKRCRIPSEKNKWNVLPYRDRRNWFNRFWYLLPVVLPLPVQEHWKAAEKIHPPTLQSREKTMEWLWKMRCTLDKGYQDPYQTACKRISHYSSDCGKATGVFTCRLKGKRTVRKNKKKRNTRKQ